MGNQIYGTRSNNLKSIGFSNYPQYLDSQLWKQIRKTVLIRDGYFCRKCNKSSAHHVHHSSYDVATLKGDDLSKLHSVCDWCHREIEFDGDDKRDGDLATAFNQWTASRTKSKVNSIHKGRKRKAKPKVAPDSRLASNGEIERIKSLSLQLGISFDSKRGNGLSQSDFYAWRTELERRIKKLEQDRLKKQFAKESRRFA